MTDRRSGSPWRRLFVGAGVAAAAVASLALSARAESDRGVRAAPIGQPAPRIPVPFGVGEKLDYDVRFGGLRVGSGTMEVSGIQSVRGRDTWHTIFRVKGGTLFYRVDDRFESWIDVESFASLRYVQSLDEGSSERERSFEIFPDRGVYVDKDGREFPTVPEPLDDGSFLYFIRTVPLEVGREYEFNRYFKTDRNPVKIRVLRRERIRVPAGEFDAVVVQPVIKTKGLFSENGRAEVWLADDSTRMMLQMKSRFARFSLNLHLKSYRIVTPSATAGR